MLQIAECFNHKPVYRKPGGLVQSFYKNIVGTCSIFDARHLGSRSAAECVAAFHVSLTPQSVAAVQSAAKTVARDWRCGFEAASGKGLNIRAKRKRTFKSVSQAFKKSVKGAAGSKEKVKAAEGSKEKTGVKKTIKKKPKLPKQKLGQITGDKFKNVPENFTRSMHGDKMIRLRVEALYEMDRTSFPTRPMFDSETQKCRLSKHFVLSVVMFGFFFGNIWKQPEAVNRC